MKDTMEFYRRENNDEVYHIHSWIVFYNIAIHRTSFSNKGERTMKRLKIVKVVEITPDSKLNELYRDDSLYEFYCPDSDLTYILKEDEEQ
jgi:hypothetical protein